MIKRLISTVAVLAAMMPQSFAGNPVAVPAPGNPAVSRQGNLVQVSMLMPVDSLKVSSNRTVVFEPVLVNGADSITFPTVGVYGRNRYIHLERGANEVVADQTLRSSQAHAALPYTATADWQEWMDGATLALRRTDYGCCANIEGEASRPLVLLELPRPFEPRFQYIRPTADATKSRQVTGRAFIDFPVNRTEIRPDYRGNAKELAKIRATIDSVRNDKDITVRALTIHGYASPEGSYANNERLAKGRTEALASYVNGLYHFPAGVIRTEWTPEDWAGLRNWLEANSIDNRDAILALVDSDLVPDAKDARIRADFPAQYAMLLRDVYPALRHSDYTVDFDIRQFTDVEEIKRLVETAPQKLSLNEFFLASQAYEPGSEAYDRVFATAVRMYPDSEIANLNAANAAMSHNDLASAAAYLAKAGDSPEAIYARGILAALQGDNNAALGLFRQAARLRVADAPAAIEQIERIIRLSGNQ